jgi:hypothetical protein
MADLTSEKIIVTTVEPLPMQIWLLIAGLALLSLAGIAWWAALLAAAAAEPLADLTWLFLCR